MAALDSAPAKSYDHVGRHAWIILWIAFSIFILLLIGIPLGIRWYINNATIPHMARVEAIRGATLVSNADEQDAVAVIDVAELQQGDTLRTDETSLSNISVFPTTDDTEPLTTVQIRNNSEVLFEKARSPRFGSSDLPDQVALRLNVGRARVTGNAQPGRDLEIVITTAHGQVRMSDGSASVAVNNDSTEVSVRSGTVTVTAQGRAVELNDGRRSVITLGQPPQFPQAMSRNLVVNGDFTQPWQDNWTVSTEVDAGDPSGVTYGRVSVVENGGRRAGYFERQGEEAIHTETAIVQEINTDVLDYESLVLQLDARLLSQSLQGCGVQSSECPLMVRIDFVDIDGNDRFWTHGFYAVDPVANWPIRDAEKIPNLVWFEYESPDFLNSPTFPRPQKVTRIRIYASGHNYRSQVSGIGLIAR